MNKLRIVIADDERPARMFLKNLLLEFEDVEIIGEAENGADTAALIKNSTPDLALLDLQMPEMSGLDAVGQLPENKMPLVAFVTAFENYAVQAFEINAIDYLMKPVEKERLRQTIERAFERLKQNDSRSENNDSRKEFEIVEPQKSESEFLERIPVRLRDEIVLVPVREVASITANGELLNITTAQNKVFVINYRLKDLEAKLPPNKFLRLSRSAIINAEMILKISPLPGGIYEIQLANGQRISSSRLESKKLRERFLRL